jgi:FixJ family two-component response regulator
MSECAKVPIVFVVDDDPHVQESLNSLFRSVDLRVETFGAASEFMKRTLPDVPSCLVLDIRLPGLGGLEFQKELADAGNHIPVKAMNVGAIDFLTKPFHEVEMLGAVKKSLEIDCVRRREGRNASEPALDRRDEVC